MANNPEQLHEYVTDHGNEWDQCLRCHQSRNAAVHWSLEEVEIYNQLERNGMV